MVRCSAGRLDASPTIFGALVAGDRIDELWATFNQSSYVSMAEVFEFARRAEVHPAVVAGRWQQQNRDFRKVSKLLGHGQVRQTLAGRELGA